MSNIENPFHHALAIGNHARAYGNYAVAFGDYSSAQGDFSVDITDNLFGKPIPEYVKRSVRQYPCELHWILCSLREWIHEKEE